MQLQSRPTNRDADILAAIALEFGDYLEFLTPEQRREALLLISLTTYTGSIHLAANHFALSISTMSLPRKFGLLAGRLSRNGLLTLSIALAQSLKDYP